MSHERVNNDPLFNVPFMTSLIWWSFGGFNQYTWLSWRSLSFDGPFIYGPIIWHHMSISLVTPKPCSIGPFDFYYLGNCLWLIISRGSVLGRQLAIKTCHWIVLLPCIVGGMRKWWFSDTLVDDILVNFVSDPLQFDSGMKHFVQFSIS